mmetsp:Transcript_20459/g.62372  ORF Transcript_20459/g.62372 Transcript_20459/m.62372 type:complete len:276 (-) Transcript_20459:2356-3183(-)
MSAATRSASSSALSPSFLLRAAAANSAAAAAASDAGAVAGAGTGTAAGVECTEGSDEALTLLTRVCGMVGRDGLTGICTASGAGGSVYIFNGGAYMSGGGIVNIEEGGGGGSGGWITARDCGSGWPCASMIILEAPRVLDISNPVEKPAWIPCCLGATTPPVAGGALTFSRRRRASDAASTGGGMGTAIPWPSTPGSMCRGGEAMCCGGTGKLIPLRAGPLPAPFAAEEATLLGGADEGTGIAPHPPPRPPALRPRPRPRPPPPPLAPGRLGKAS